jgi:hypothetical protein
MNAVTLRVPGPFAVALLADLRDPPEDLDEPTTDPEQIAADAALDACIEAWKNALDGEGERTLDVPEGAEGEWFRDYVREIALEGLTSTLYDGSTTERNAALAALAGWVEVMQQIEQGTLSS